MAPIINLINKKVKVVAFFFVYTLLVFGSHGCQPSELNEQSGFQGIDHSSPKQLVISFHCALVNDDDTALVQAVSPRLRHTWRQLICDIRDLRQCIKANNLDLDCYSNISLDYLKVLYDLLKDPDKLDFDFITNDFAIAENASGTQVAFRRLEEKWYFCFHGSEETSKWYFEFISKTIAHVLSSEIRKSGDTNKNQNKQ
ncbi:MAG: DUF4509 domain-containing protein [Phycisphaerae bacterium]|nr:DUF4509 domain-containing protein [Phycisphaerae bacterium]